MGIFHNFNNCSDKEDFLKEFQTCRKELFSKKWYRQIPNMLTASRLLTPLVVFFLLVTHQISAAYIAIAAFLATDALDGAIANTAHLQSKFGAKLDPLCDKIFFLGALFPMFAINLPLTLAAIGMELVITVHSGISAAKNNHPEPTLLGRIKTNLLGGSIIVTYLSHILSLPIDLSMLSTVLLLPSVVVQMATAKQYIQIDMKKDEEKRKLGVDPLTPYDSIHTPLPKKRIGYETIFKKVLHIITQPFHHSAKPNMSGSIETPCDHFISPDEVILEDKEDISLTAEEQLRLLNQEKERLLSETEVPAIQYKLEQK